MKEAQMTVRPRLINNDHAAKMLGLQRKREIAPLAWRSKRLRDPQECKTYLQSVVNRVESGLLDPQTATRLASVVQCILSCIKAGELEDMSKRIAELETQLKASE